MQLFRLQLLERPFNDLHLYKIPMQPIIEEKNRPNWFQRANRRFGWTVVGRWLYARLLHRIDGLVLRLSRGKHTATNLISDLPMISLTIVGAKSGRPRTIPLIGTPDRERIILVASNWGRSNRPAWYYNVKANPQVTVSANGRSGTYLAREVMGDERQLCWEKATAFYPGYDLYQEMIKGREIPVIVLDPRDATEKLTQTRSRP